MEISDKCHFSIAVLSVCSMILNPYPTFMSRIIGALCVSLPMLLIAVVVPGAFGGGDVKLMMVSGCFLGWRIILTSAVASVFLGGTYCVYLLLWKQADRNTVFPFGPFLCLGMLIGTILEIG